MGAHAHLAVEAAQPRFIAGEREVETGEGARRRRVAAVLADRVDQIDAVVGPTALLAGAAIGAGAAVRAPAGDVGLEEVLLAGLAPEAGLLLGHEDALVPERAVEPPHRLHMVP